MGLTKSKIDKNLREIRANIAGACERSGRDINDVKIVAVTKAVDIDAMKALIDLGVLDLAENRTTQLAERVKAIDAFIQRKRKSIDGDVTWHMIGHLQRNKVKSAVTNAGYIHSVDSLRLAEEINTKAEKAGVVANVMLQVNCSCEPQKHGVAVGAAMYMGELVASMKYVKLTGLMTMARISDDPETSRPVFIRLRELFEEMRHDGIGGEDFSHLSMGMSQDYIVAAEEGATMLRIGSAIFKE